MIYYKKEFEKKLIDKDLNRKKLAEKLGITANTLHSKIEDTGSEFKLSHAQKIADILDMTTSEFLLIFFNKKLSPDESLTKVG